MSVQSEHRPNEILLETRGYIDNCSRWGRITILTQLSEYPTSDIKEMEHICERVVPQFQHVNPSVVIAAIKVVFAHMKYLNQELVRTYLRKMAPPLGMKHLYMKVELGGIC